MFFFVFSTFAHLEPTKLSVENSSVSIIVIWPTGVSLDLSEQHQLRFHPSFQSCCWEIHQTYSNLKPNLRLLAIQQAALKMEHHHHLPTNIFSTCF